MKHIHKFILILTFICISGFAVNAQLRYGFRFGGEFASASLKNAGEYSLINRSGFTGGLMLEYQAPKCGFATDLAIVYSRHNIQLKNFENNKSGFGRNFIDLPLHFKYKFWLKSTSGLFGPMIYTGPAFCFKLDHKDSSPLRTQTFQPGWDVGIGFDIINFLQITGGYRFSLGNAVKEFSGFPDASLKPDGWNITVNIIFDF